MEERVTEKIKLWGIVQGVGFRPFVAKCADKYGMKGEVLNIGGLVDIIVSDTPRRIDSFVQAIAKEKPVPAEIVHMSRTVLGREGIGSGFRDFSAFTILDSDHGDDEAAMIPADLSICPGCLSELGDPKDLRFEHPFISCMVCGPRYTIIDKIPYDRENTAMTDWPMCADCQGEYTDRNDRRYHAQTISCHNCGPQLMLRDRDISGGTEDFVLGYIRRLKGTGCGGSGNCCSCNREQSREEKRREINRGILTYICSLLRAGCVIAMKGVGGYNLIADPLIKEGVSDLRAIKNREKKPFAVMFKDMEELRGFCRVDSVEESLINSSPKPIILLEHKEIEEIKDFLDKKKRGAGVGAGSFIERDFSEIRESRFIGSFLPSMAAQHMLLDMYGGPLIVTSANLSDMPIIKDEEEMFSLMDRQPLIAACLYNERDIRVRMDDSVMRAIDGQPQMIRRSKGYAPVPLFIKVDEEIRNAETGEPSERVTKAERGQPDKSVMVFAAGGQLKNSFALSKGSFSYVSQYFGDLDSVENQRIYDENVERMEGLFRIRPMAAACDMHPLYYTTKFAEALAAAKNLKLIRVQHHHAHVASVMAEHHLSGRVLGVSMDGTGYGTDGNIWGGEFLLCRGGRFQRAAHMKYVNMIGGDGSMKEAWKSAMCYIYHYENQKNDSQSEDGMGKQGFSLEDGEITLDLDYIFEYARRHNDLTKREEWPVIAAALKSGVNSILSSSMGRIFDGAAALLGIKEYNDYEGQCAIMLEDAAARALKNPGSTERDDLALRFHRSIAQMIASVCESIRRESREASMGDEQAEPIQQIALTGGVFQNKILMEMTLELLRKAGFSVYYNVSVSPNDGGIALGQNYVALCDIMEEKE